MEYKNILLIKMSSLGDILHSLPFAAALRGRFPHAKITWLVHPQFAGFLPDPPVIDEVIYFDKVKFNKMGLCDKLHYFKEMRRLLHSKHFDLVIDLQGLFKSAVLAAISGCPERIGYCEMREGSKFISRPITLNGDYVVMVPGARWETKVWPPENYAKLAEMLIAAGTSVVLAGGPDDAPKGEAIAEKCKSAKLINLIGQTSLRELAALIKSSSFYISGDTGPLHFAAALKKPLIAMYGPTKADRTGPYGSDNSTVIISPAKCAGCLKKHCSDWHCMYDITPEMVFETYTKKRGEMN